MDKRIMIVVLSVLVAVFIIVSGTMLGKASADYDQQKFQMQIECIKVGGTPVTTSDRGGFICSKK